MKGSMSLVAPAVCLLGALVAGLAQADEPRTLDTVLPVRGFCIAAPGVSDLDAFVAFIDQELAPRRINTLILRVDYNFQYTSRPELASADGLSKADAAKLVEVCRKHGIRLIPQVNLLGHQSWAGSLGKLLEKHPEFDETPWVNLPEKYEWPNADGLYCKSYCPLHPEVHDVVFPIIDEICDAFEADAFHAGFDEVFYIGMDRCPRCAGQDRSKLFADEVTRLRDHLAQRNRRLWIWADRLIDGKTTGLGEWEASENDTHRAVTMIPKDVVLCDWHYEQPAPTTVAFALAGFDVVACPWRKASVALGQLDDIVRARASTPAATRDHLLGIMQTSWTGADSFLEEFSGRRPPRPRRNGSTRPADTESNCFRALTAAIARLDPAKPDGRPRRLLVIGQSKGYQHDAMSTAMARIYDLGRTTGLWETTLRTDCANITRKPLRWDAPNLDAFDAVVFFTDGELDMDESQKADLMAFIQDEGKGFLGLHSAVLTFPSWPEFGQMLGGRFDGHPWGQFDASLLVDAPDFPGFDRLPSSFTLRDEIYQIKDFGADDVRVLLRLDPEKVDLGQDGVRSGPHGFPVAWARPFGKGRVMYNGLGHCRDVWERPEFEPLWVDSIRWVLGLAPGDATPRKSATATSP